MTDTMTSQNIDLSFWDTLYIHCLMLEDEQQNPKVTEHGIGMTSNRTFPTNTGEQWKVSKRFPIQSPTFAYFCGVNIAILLEPG
jgi:hypothetical protein